MNKEINISLNRDNETFIYDYFKNVDLDLELEREELIQKINEYYDELK